jgi:hypothetical protein
LFPWLNTGVSRWKVQEPAAMSYSSLLVLDLTVEIDIRHFADETPSNPLKEMPRFIPRQSMLNSPFAPMMQLKVIVIQKQG